MSEFKLGWIDFSREQRNKVMSVINLLTEPEAVDELGIGLVRDGFANIFFPGTSTLQTRAKYFLLTPYLMNAPELQKILTPDKLITQLNNEELNLIDILKKSGEKGIIGETAGRKLKRKPSDIYWNGIRSFGIFTGGRISLYEYARTACQLSKMKQDGVALGNYNDKQEEIEGDDKDAFRNELTGELWRLPNLWDNWKSNIDINLTFDEAIFLKNRICISYPETLLGEALSREVKSFKDLESFDAIAPFLGNFSESIQRDYERARAFSDFIYGAQLRYNMILSKGKDDKICEAWATWSRDMHIYSSLDLDDILTCRLQIKNYKLQKFLRDCKTSMESQDIEELDKVITRRELQLKGDKRAKLHNAADFDYQNWVGIGKLQYRLRNGQNLIKDIFEGLGNKDA